MSFPRPTRLAALLVIGTLPFAVAVATSAADEPAPLAGTVDEVDPLAGFEPAEPLPVEVEEGATVTQEACVIGDRPNVDAPIFRRPIRTSGHLVVTPSGNAHFVCHAQASRAAFGTGPTEAVVLEALPCTLPDGRRTRDSRLVVTPSLRVHLTCHN